MMRNDVITTRSARETKALAKKIIAGMTREKTGPLILALKGNLGSGKTTFIQGLAETLGVTEKIQSPTFVLMKWYALPRRLSPFRHLVHVDAYRFESAQDAKHIGIAEILKDRDAVVVIEWADRIQKLLPPRAHWIFFRHGADTGTRTIEIRNKK